MPITETDLPGVGKKHEIELDDQILVVVTHNTGKREVFTKPGPGADSERLFQLSDQLSRTVGTILEGAYFQPVQSDKTQTSLGDGTVIEWFDIESGATLEGETLAGVLENEGIEAAIVAIQRGESVIPASKPDTVLEADDTIVAVGTLNDLERFEELLTSDGSEAGSV